MTFSAPMTGEGPSCNAEPGGESFSTWDPSAMVSPKANSSVVCSLVFIGEFNILAWRMDQIGPRVPEQWSLSGKSAIVWAGSSALGGELAKD